MRAFRIKSVLTSLLSGRELDCEIIFNWSPPERMTRDYPGCDAEVEVTLITLEGGIRDISPIFDAEEVDEVCFKYIEDWASDQEDSRAEAFLENREYWAEHDAERF